MKRFVCLLLCLIMMIFTGCTQVPTPQQTTNGKNEPITPSSSESVQTTPPSEDSEQQYPFGLNAVSLPILEDDYFADDGTLLFTHSYQDLSLVTENTEIADVVTLAFLNRSEGSLNGANQILQAARDDYSDPEGWQSYFLESRIQPTRLDQLVLSLMETQVIFDGSPRPAHVDSAVTYDLLTGTPLTLSGILTDDFSADLLSDHIRNALDAQDDFVLYEDYSQIINDLFSTNTLMDTWYFSSEGLCFFFGSGEIAPMNVGSVHACIPYSQLSGILRDEYFPMEAVAYTGTVKVIPFSDADTNNFSKFIELGLEADAPQCLITTDGVLQNVELLTGVWQSDGSFTKTATLFSAEAISRSHGLVLSIGENAMSSLCLQYVSQGKLYQVSLGS